jgi:hypothetical protein
MMLSLYFINSVFINAFCPVKIPFIVPNKSVLDWTQVCQLLHYASKNPTAQKWLLNNQKVACTMKM